MTKLYEVEGYKTNSKILKDEIQMFTVDIIFYLIFYFLLLQRILIANVSFFDLKFIIKLFKNQKKNKIKCHVILFYEKYFFNIMYYL